MTRTVCRRLYRLYSSSVKRSSVFRLVAAATASNVGQKVRKKRARRSLSHRHHRPRPRSRTDGHTGSPQGQKFFTESRATQPLPPSLATTPGRTLLYPGEIVGFGMGGGGLGGYGTSHNSYNKSGAQKGEGQGARHRHISLLRIFTRTHRSAQRGRRTELRTGWLTGHTARERICLLPRSHPAQRAVVTRCLC